MLTCPVTATKAWREAVGALAAAREHAAELLGRPLIEDLVDHAAGEVCRLDGRRGWLARSR